MQYVSTRGHAPMLGFADTLLAGLATDGGLYVPETWPTTPALGALDRYCEQAVAVMWPYVEGAFERRELDTMCRAAYQSFDTSAVVPLTEIGAGHFLLELFHGPTLAFKDVALQLVGQMFDFVLAQRSTRLTIVGATSGDTGSAAIDAVKSCDNVDIVILYPHGGTSEVQRRQMTTVTSENVHTVAIDGTFDDCQALVKAMFADVPFRESLQLSAVNSINWARVMAQIVYYATAAARFDEPVSFCVPTGNFGNVFAGWVAKRTGASIAELLIASNENDILTRFVNHGDMSVHPVARTISPSMDIAVSSNFERLLFEMNNRDGTATGQQMASFATTGVLRVEPEQQRRCIDSTFRAARVSDPETLAEIARTYRESGVLIDPHTATATAAVRRLGPDRPVISLATAHPAKFPDAVEQATGVRPALPDHLGDLFERPERITRLPNDLAQVQRFVRSVSRVANASEGST